MNILEFVRSIFPNVRESNDGVNAALVCPECRKKKNTSKLKLAFRTDNGKWHCWSCGASGKNLGSFVKRFCSYNDIARYYETFEHSRSYRLDENSAEETQQDVSITLPEGFTLLATYRIGSDRYFDPYVRRAISYLRSRGLGARDLWYFKFGITGYSLYSNRIVMPSFDAGGKINYYTCRSWERDVERKYLNCPTKKHTIIFNELNIDWTLPLTLVEGPFDLTKCNDNATCLLGRTLTERSLLFQRITEYKTPVLLTLDADALKQTIEISGLLERYGVDVRIVRLSENKDPGDMKREEFIELLKTAEQWNRLKMMVEQITCA